MPTLTGPDAPFASHVPATASFTALLNPTTAPLRVLHVIHSLDPAAGGPPAVAVRLAAAQAAAAHHVEIASYSDPGNLDPHSAVPGLRRVRLHCLPPPTRLQRLLPRLARRSLIPMIARAHLVHLHGVWDPILRAAAAMAFASHVPYVVTPHGMLDPWSLRQKRWKKRLALALGYRRMLDRAAFLHALNHQELSLLAPLRLACPVRVIPNGVFPQEVQLPPADPGFFRTRCGIQGGPVILFLGRLHHKKGLDYLARAFEYLAADCPDAHLVVAGPDAGARHAFEQHVRRAGLAHRVHLPGPLYGPEKFAALAEASCFCLPSRQEGFSVAILEALVSKLPVVISDACHFPEVAEVGAGIVVPLDPRPLAAALLDVIRDPVKRQQMGDAGHRLVHDHYTWPAIAHRFTDAYRAAASLA